jgi:hypothetical protein
VRYELYSLYCPACKAENKPGTKKCIGCDSPLTSNRHCQFCKKENPINAYVCIYCYRIMREKPRVGVWHYHMPWSVSVIVISLAAGSLAYMVARGIYNALDSHIESAAATERFLAMQQAEARHREGQ